MSIVVPTLAVAFAAVCVWLGVRVYNRRERWAKWTLGAVVGLPILYALSFGLACRVASCRFDADRGAHQWRIPTFYWPIQTYVPVCPGGSAAVKWYVTIFLPMNSDVLVPFDRQGELAWVRYFKAAMAPPPGGL
jgi:hypothetical protein